jgi:hypothetical protein
MRRILAPLPEPVASFFSTVSQEGFPRPAEKIQPWRKIWKGPQAPSPDGKLVVACPKRCDYGMEAHSAFVVQKSFLPDWQDDFWFKKSNKNQL